MSELVHCWGVSSEVEQFPENSYQSSYQEWVEHDPNCEIEIVFWRVK